MICPVCEHDNLEDARFCGSCGAPIEDESAHVHELLGELVGGRYRIKRVIGEGGMGVVYEAEQQMGPMTRTVAVKTLLPWMSRDPSIRSRFYREGGTVSQLEHPNTVRVYDFGETTDGRLYIAMEFVRGEPLTKAIEAGPIAADRVKAILRQVCGALEEAHQQGIVHRDLKPDNIVLSHRGGEEDFVKVLDFGIAARTGAAANRQTKLTKQGMVLGTPPYMSPEQLSGEEVDPKSDVYSLGVIAYEMLTGKLPFEADTPWQWAQKHMMEKPRALTTVTDRPIPSEMEQAVLSALAKRPADRPASALQFYRLLTGEGVAATAPDAPRERTTPMPAPPDFSGRGMTEVGGQPQFRTGAAVAAPIPPPPPPERERRGRWLGWTLALTGVAALAAATLFSTGVIEMPRRGQSEMEGAGGALVQPSELSTTEIAPLVTEAPPVLPPPPAEPNQSIDTEPKKSDPKKKKDKTPKAEPPPVLPPPPTAQPPPAQPPPAQPPPAQPPPAQPPPPTLPPPPSTQPEAKPRMKVPEKTGVQGDAACAASEQAARGGNIEGAVALYRTCASTGGSSSAQGAARIRIRQQAPLIVRRRGFNGDCVGARSAANAASSIGEGAAAQAALAQTSC